VNRLYLTYLFEQKHQCTRHALRLRRYNMKQVALEGIGDRNLQPCEGRLMESVV